MRGVRWARSSSRSSFVDSLPAPRASERCALGFTLIIDDINAVMISTAESVPLRMTFPAWCPTNTGILIAENISGGARCRRPKTNRKRAPVLGSCEQGALLALDAHASPPAGRVVRCGEWMEGLLSGP